MRVATLDILVRLQDQASKGLTTLGDKIRFAGARLRNAGIGLSIAMAPFAIAMNRSLQNAMEFDQVSRSISKVATTTGRDVAEVFSIIDRHSGEMSSKLDMTRGTLKLLSTDLSNVQINEFIQLVKDGSAAMGEDFGVQMRLVTRGFKQLNPNVIDNIGINVRMKDIYRKVAATGNKTNIMYANMIMASEELTDAQKDAAIEQTLFTEMQRKGAVFGGIYAAQMNTTAGRVQKLKARLTDLSVEIGTAFLPHLEKAVEKVMEVVDAFDRLDKDIRDAVISLGGWGVIIGVVGAGLLLLGGNLIWAAGQLLLFVKAIWAARVAVLAFSLEIGAMMVLAVSLWMAFGVVVKVIDLLRDAIVFAGKSLAKFIMNINIAILDLRKMKAELEGNTDAWEKLDRRQAQAVVALDNIDSAARGMETYGDDFISKATYPWRTLGEEGRWAADFRNWIGGFFGPAAEQPEYPELSGGTGAGAGGPNVAGTQMYGDLIINIAQPGTAEYGTSTDIEQIIATLLATLQQSPSSD